MSEREPVALWKGIVGTALSGTLLFVLVPVFYRFSFVEKGTPMWIMIILFVSIAVCIFTLIISILNLISASNYKRELRNMEEQEEDDDKTELLHKLLSEGKITIEEYDELRKK